ncbi:MAG: ISAs1 family transposase, partial [Gammaproteobacteria bacterium]|nr:ISAs1 family transposase [Gammaproteobacteria bacterium]
MKEKAGTNTPLLERLAEIPDPRIEKKCAHPLINIMAIAICAVIGGADDWNTIESFGKAKKAWFETFLDLENGIPSHDTFRRLFSILSEKTFREFFTSWVREVA